MCNVFYFLNNWTAITLLKLLNYSLIETSTLFYLLLIYIVPTLPWHSNMKYKCGYKLSSLIARKKGKWVRIVMELTPELVAEKLNEMYWWNEISVCTVVC
jgi:hypothetical protein